MKRAGEPSTAHVVSRNAIVSLGRVLLNAGVYLLLPLLLTRWMPVTNYSAWVLILQLSAYIAFLDLGGQAGIAKFVAEFVARKDNIAAGKRASTGLAIMIFAAVLGTLLSIVLAWQVPRLFSTMPQALWRDESISVLLMGISLSIGLIGSAYSAVFMGLQRYAIPMAISILQRGGFSVAVIVAAYYHCSLMQMALAGAIVNVAAVASQVLMWRLLAPQIAMSLRLVEKPIVMIMLRYCLVLALWSGAMLCINGLDVTLVGHYEFSAAAYYAVAAMPNSLMIASLTAILSPLIPAASALSTQVSADRMGELLVRVSRYSALFLLASGVPLIAGGYVILSIWVGHNYAVHALPFMRILIVANMIRYVCAPYATMVIAMGKQWAATASGVSEAVVNLTASILLAQRYGAIGVAYGTLAGAIVGVSIHILISMGFTRDRIDLSRISFLKRAFWRPSLIALPCALVIIVSLRATTVIRSLETFGTSVLILGFFTWFVGLTSEERSKLRSLLFRFAVLKPRPVPGI